MSINDKIKQVLLDKNLSPSYLADDIGVQRSSISHILSGRNRPSLDIIQKIVRRFPEFSYEWFLDDDIQLSTEESVAHLPVANPRRADQRDSSLESTRVTFPVDQPRQTTPSNRPIVPKQTTPLVSLQPAPILDPTSPVSPAKQIDRILIFYTDGTFREFTPA